MTAHAMTLPIGPGVTRRRVVASGSVVASRSVVSSRPVVSGRPALSSRPARPVRPALSVRPIPTAVGRVRRIGLVVLLVTAALVGLYAPGAFAGAEPAAAGSFDTYTVAQGESLWSIATGLTAPGEDVRDTVSRLQTLNAMGDSTLRAGEQILIPALEG